MTGQVVGGRRGLPGRGISSVAINGSSHLIITYDDGTTTDAGVLPSTGAGTVASTGITDSTSVGRAVLTAATQAAARTAIGAGTGSGSGLPDADYGDVTLSGSGTVMTVDNNAITLAKMADIATSSIIGRVTASTGDPEVLTATQVRTLINVANGATANSADATLLARANHTGSEPLSALPVTVPMWASVALGGTPVRPSNESTRLCFWIVEDTDDVPLVTSGTAGRYATDVVLLKVTA